MTSRFLTELTCKVCGQPMKLDDPDGGFTGGWPEEDRMGNTVAEHWVRRWSCECGAFAEEFAVDNDPFNDDPDRYYLEPDGEPEWHDKDGESLDDDVPLPPEFQTEGYWVKTEAGNEAHVLVSPDMSPEGWEALKWLIDAAAKAIDEGTIKDEANDAR